MQKSSKHKNNVKKRYNEITTQCSKSTYIKYKHYNKLLDELKLITYTVDSLNIKYNQIIQKTIKDPESIIQELPIESLNDYYEAEKYGKPLKPSFADVIEAGKIKKVGLETIEEKEELMRNTRISYIELLEAKVRFLLRQLES